MKNEMQIFNNAKFGSIRTLDENGTELAETLLSLTPVMSRRTILENLPWVTDVEEELRRKEAETDEN